MGAAIPAAYIAYAALAATALSTGAAVYAQQQSAEAQENQAKYREKVAENNAVVAEQAAEDARARGAVAERQQRLKNLQLIGQQRAAFADRGVVVDEGTALSLVEDTAAFGELDALTIRNNAEREALGFETQADQFRGTAGLLQTEQDNINNSLQVGVATTVLSGAQRVSNKWYAFDDQGTFE